MASDAESSVYLPSPDSWTARRTSDGKVSVIDVIADVRQVSHENAKHTYTRLLDEERIQICETRPLPPRVHSLMGTDCTHQSVGRGGG